MAIVFCCGVTAFANGLACTSEEHQRLTETAFENTLTAIGGTATAQALTLPLDAGAKLVMPAEIWRDLRFSAAVVHFAQDDRSAARFHRRGQTIQMQLGEITAADLESARRAMLEIPVSGESNSAPKVDVVTRGRDGVVANFFRYHWLAMQYARMAAASADQRAALLRRGLVLEAVALGYLTDAFSAGHLLPADSGLLGFLHPNNSNRLHDSYASSGVFVIDSRHQVWLTFGDGLLYWYPKSMARVLNTCETSLREFLVCFYATLSPAAMPPALTAWLAAEFPGQDSRELASRWLTTSDSEKYYTEMRLSSLVRLPMPIAATWSVRTETEDEHGIRLRKHYPQTRETGSFDPTLPSHQYNALYARTDLPAWMRLPLLDEESPTKIISFEKDVAAPIFVQAWHKEPSIIGGVLTGGVGYLRTGATNSPYAVYGFGVGLSDEFIHVQYLPNFTQIFLQANLKDEIDGESRMIAAAIAMRVHMPGIVNLHLETGVTKGIRGQLNRAGPHLAVGLTSRTVTLPGIYIGAQLRSRYEASFLEEITHGLLIEVVLF